ncbi:unnamed protein product, partial [Cylicocyclus nassatus]
MYYSHDLAYNHGIYQPTVIFATTARHRLMDKVKIQIRHHLFSSTKMTSTSLWK